MNLKATQALHLVIGIDDTKICKKKLKNLKKLK